MIARVAICFLATASALRVEKTNFKLEKTPLLKLRGGFGRTAHTWTPATARILLIELLSSSVSLPHAQVST